jgi:hypothetical protein
MHRCDAEMVVNVIRKSNEWEGQLRWLGADSSDRVGQRIDVACARPGGWPGGGQTRRNEFGTVVFTMNANYDDVYHLKEASDTTPRHRMKVCE